MLMSRYIIILQNVLERTVGFSMLSDVSPGLNTLSVEHTVIQAYMTGYIIRMHTHVFRAYNREDIRISGLDSSAIIYKPRSIPLYTGCT